MKSLFAVIALIASTSAHAATCSVETAKSYVAGIEAVAADVTNGRIDMGDKVNGRTISKSDIKAISADSAYVITVTNRQEDYHSKGNYSKYVVTLKQVGSACFPASITLIGNTSESKF